MPGGLLRARGRPANPHRIAGIIYTDHDGDGKRSEGEPYRAGQVVYLDVDENGRFGQGEPNTVTDANGAYRFREVRPGTYQVRLDLGPKSERTFPGKDPEVTITTAVKDAEDVDFAVNDRRLKRPVRPSTPTPPPGSLVLVGLVALAARRPGLPRRHGKHPGP